mgnify:FL=1
MKLLQPLKQIGILIPLLLLLIVQYRLWFDDSGIVASKALSKKIEQIQSENNFHQGENNKLLAEVTELRQGTDLLEERAREELGLIREGESFILFADPETP